MQAITPPTNYLRAITTYSGKGVSKNGVKKSEHAIIYTGKEAPSTHPDEEPARGEEGMRKASIRVNLDHKTDKLDTMSRIDFGKVYTIQHNLKVRSLGKVHQQSMNSLFYLFHDVWKVHVGPSSSQQPRNIGGQTSGAFEATVDSSRNNEKDLQSARKKSKGGKTAGQGGNAR